MTWYTDFVMWIAMACMVAMLCVSLALTMYAGYRDRWGK